MEKEKKSLPKAKNKGGRPTLYTEALAKRICNLIATTPRGLKSLCESNAWMPDHQTVKNWRALNPGFFAFYLQAKESQAHAVADKLWQEADQLPADTAEVNRFNAVFRFHQWHLSKLAPKNFGDKKEDTQSATVEQVATIANALLELNKKHARDY